MQIKIVIQIPVYVFVYFTSKAVGGASVRDVYLST